MATCFDSSIANPFLVQGVFLLPLQSLSHSQDGEEVRISVSVCVSQRSMPCIAIVAYYHHWYTICCPWECRSSTLTVRLLGECWKLRRYIRQLLMWQKGSYTFAKACIQLQCWDSFHPVLFFRPHPILLYASCVQGSELSDFGL